MKPRSKWCLISLPDHQGVMNVGGRLGAARGPQAFERAWSRFKPELQGRAPDLTLAPVSRDVARNHEAAAALVRQAHDDASTLSVVVGGGHDHGYSHLLGLRQALQKRLGRKPRLGCINLDAHLDLRPATPVITSGSPFWLAIENGVLDGPDLVEFGIQAQCNAQSLRDYASLKNVTVIPFEKLRGQDVPAAFARALDELSSRCDAVVVSLDLDCVAQAFAPGVSAPVAEGFTPMEIAAVMELSGQNTKVPSLGIFELNPEHDIDQRTALLAATSAYRFLAKALA